MTDEHVRRAYAFATEECVQLTCDLPGVAGQWAGLAPAIAGAIVRADAR